MAGDEDTSCGQRMSARCSAFAKFLYNSEEGKIVGRTPKSWLLITIFFLIYYSLLAGFFIGMLSVLLYGVIEENTPRLTGDHSLLRMNPGLAMRPQPDVERTLVAYNMKKADSYAKYVQNLDELAAEFKNNTQSSSSSGVEQFKCNLSDAQANKGFDPTKKICDAQIDEEWGPCKPGEGYGYSDGKPCIIIKMNKIFGWLPETQDNKTNHALLECIGENDGDKPNIGRVEYFPSATLDGKTYGRFSSALFPYLRQSGYNGPSVAVKFNNIRQNVMVMVECKLKNLKNSVYDKLDRQAMVRFELAVFNPKD